MQAGFDGADAVVTHPTFGMVTIPVAHAASIPVAVGHLFPMMIPTAEWTPPLGSRSPRLPSPVNRIAWSALRRISGRAFRDATINAARGELGQPAVRGNAGWAWMAADTTVVLASRHYYGEGAGDWPAVTWGGFSVWEGAVDAPVDRTLDAYVDDGDPPVLVMLGTSAASGAGRTFARIAADLDALGHRSVLLVGDPANLGHVADRPGVAAFAPVAALLPRCSVAVVSGALGGVAAALRAGTPMVVHPQLFDQVWHGRRVQDLGVGIMARRPAQVAAAVRRITDDPGYAERALALADRMASEDGTGAMVRAVEDLLVR